jgi:hypothetical protein
MRVRFAPEADIQQLGASSEKQTFVQVPPHYRFRPVAKCGAVIGPAHRACFDPPAGLLRPILAASDYG